MNTLGALELATPAMLFGLALLGLPVAAHLLHRQARRRVVFPSTLLLMEAAANQSQLFKLRRLLLLLLRCLAMALLILAFARPLWLKSAAEAVAAEDGVSLVILFDISASTAQQGQSVRAIDELRAAADRAVGSLLTGADGANIVYAAARPHAAFPKMTSNLAAIRGEIQSIKPSNERADLSAALALAGKFLAERGGSRRLVILSDFQATNWADSVSRLATEWPLPEKTEVTFIPVTSPASGNLALSDAALVPAMPIGGRAASATVKLTNYSASPESVTIRLEVDGRPHGGQTVLLNPWQQREVAFEISFDHLGMHRLRFDIPDDSLAADNSCHIVTRVVDRIPVVVLADDDPNEPGTSSYFTTRALAPFGDQRDSYKVLQAASSQATWKDLSTAATVFVCHVNEMPQALTAALHRYVDSGHGLVIFCGGGPVDRNLGALDQLAEGRLLPWELGGFRDVAAHGEQLYLSRGDWQSSLLRIFDQRSQLVLSQIRIGRAWDVVSVRPEAQLLLKFSDGTPALAMTTVGAGKLMVANFSPDLSDSDLGKYGTFVALVQGLVSNLQPKRTTRDRGIVGQPLTFSSEQSIEAAEGGLAVRGPDDRPIAHATFSNQADDLVVQLSSADSAGIYVASQHGEPIGMAAANMDPRESDLRRLDLDRLREKFLARGTRAGVAAATDGDEGALQWRGRPLWGWMLLVALAVLGLEMALVGYWRR